LTAPCRSTMLEKVAVRSLHHVSINVDDVAAALRFYVDGLGLRVRSDRPGFNFDGAWLDAGDRQVHLIEAEVPENLGQHLALLVDDLDDIVGTLRRQGYDVSEPVSVGEDRQAFVSDPCGNGVELHQSRQA
jgi:glyoxylase I family protein